MWFAPTAIVGELCCEEDSHARSPHKMAAARQGRTMSKPSPREPLRRCSRCGDLKPVAEFAWNQKSSGQRKKHCRACQARYHRKHYVQHRDQYIARAARRTRGLVAERARYLISLFSERACVDCGESDPLVLEFDHLGDKKFSISRGLRERNWQAVLDEIAKCDVVCANCHRRRTALRAGSVRAVLAQQQLTHLSVRDVNLLAD
jgi:5-methylcytosine-specific restriction endonuclease McrA